MSTEPRPAAWPSPAARATTTNRSRWARRTRRRRASSRRSGTVSWTTCGSTTRRSPQPRSPRSRRDVDPARGHHDEVERDVGPVEGHDRDRAGERVDWVDLDGAGQDTLEGAPRARRPRLGAFAVAVVVLLAVISVLLRQGSTESSA